MLRHALILALFAYVNARSSEQKQTYVDPFAALDKHISHSLAYHYLWPWSQLIRAAAALDIEEALEEPKIYSDSSKFEITMNVKRFKPEELKVKVKNRYITIEGKHKETDEVKQFMANHFVQRFAIPAGSKPEEVKAELRENGILSVWAPKYELPPPPPEREVPIEVKLPATTTKPEDSTTPEPTTSKKEEAPQTAPPVLEQEVAEATTHIGKSRKKELKTTIRPQRDNEVGKGVDGNGLDYIEADE